MNLAAELAANALHLIVNLTLLGASVAAGTALAFRLTRVAPPRARYWIAVAAFAVAAAAPLAATFYATAEPEHAVPIGVKSVSTVNPIANQTANHIDAAKPSIPPIRTFILPLSVPIMHRLKAVVRLAEESPMAISFLAAWVGVALLLLAREAAGHVMLARARRAWQPAPTARRQELIWPDEVRLYLDEQAGPSAVGWLRPAVVLPARLFTDLPAEAAQRIARHEVAHAQWRDPLVNALLRIVRAALWPSLPLWFLARVIHAEREAAADRAAMELTSSSAEASRMAADYAASLVLLAQWPRRAAYRITGTQLGGVAGLEDRVQRLLRASARLTFTRLALGSATLIAGIMGMAFLPVMSQPFKPAPATLAQRAPEQVRVALPSGAQRSLRDEAASVAADAPASVQREATKREALETATADVATSSNPERDIASFREQTAAQFFEQMAQDPSARLAAEAKLIEKLGRDPDFPLQLPSPNHAPLSISQAVAKQITREEHQLLDIHHLLRYIEIHGRREGLSLPSSKADEYTTFPRVTVINNSNRRITKFVLGFQMKGSDKPGIITGAIRAQLAPGASFIYRTKWQGPNFSWPVGSYDVKVIVLSVFFEDGSTWGDFPISDLKK